MIKFFKKHKLKIITSLFCAFAMALFTIISFSCKTYAYTIDNNGNLVGDNLLQNSNNITLNETQLYFPIDLNENNTYTFSIQNGSGSNFYAIQLRDSNGNILQTMTNGTLWSEPTTFTCNVTNETTFYIYANDIRNCNLMLNLGDTAKEWEPYGVWYSSANYDTLDNNYDILQDSYNSLADLSQYGWLKYIDNLDLSIGGSFVEDFTFNELITNNYITNNKLNVYDLSRLSNPNYTYSTIDIYFNNTYSNTDYFSYSLFGLTSNGEYCNSTISIYDNDGNVAVFEFTDSFVVITPKSIIDKNNLFNGNIYSIKIYNTSPDSAINFFTDTNYGLGYQSGYNYGIAYGTNYYTPIINELNSKVSNLENNVNELTNNINTLKSLNEDLQNQLSNQVGWQSLFFAMADTPIRTVSNVLGFELFGLNLFSTFIGMVTVFAIVWLLKKFI